MSWRIGAAQNPARSLLAKYPHHTSPPKDVLMITRRRSILALVLAALAATAIPQAHAQSNVLRVVPHSNLAILDPI